MRIARCSAVLSIFLLIIASPAILHAQSPETGRSVGYSITTVDYGPPTPIISSPYTLTFKSTIVQTLGNGVTITHETITHTARDSHRHIYNHSESAPDIWRTQIYDQVSNTTTTWDSSQKVVTITHFPDPNKPPPTSTSTTHTAPPSPPPPIPREQAEKPQIEELGTKTILGVIAKGERNTESIPAESVGNDLPFTVVHEWWYSPDLGMNLIEIQDDPRTYKVTNEVTDFQRVEPDASLFQLPEGYTVKDVYVHPSS